MVAMLVLEASVERRASSSLAPGTILKHILLWMRDTRVGCVGLTKVCFNMVYAPFVYWLGHPPFTQVRGVRFSYGVPSFRSQDVHGRIQHCHC